MIRRPPRSPLFPSTTLFRSQSADPNARLLWTTGVFFAENRQTYLEQIHDPMLQELVTALMPGSTIVDVFGVGYDAASGFPTRSEEHTTELQSPCNLVCRLLP